jgi:hypothetical protein
VSVIAYRNILTTTLSPPFTEKELHRLLDPEYIKLKKDQQQGLAMPGKDGPEDPSGRGGGRSKRDMSEVMCFKVCCFPTRPPIW